MKYGISPDRDEYMDWREAGLIVYCIQDSDYWEGRNGAGYQRVCQASSESAFLAGYRAGQSVFDAIEKVLSIRPEMASAKDRIGSLENEIRKLESADGEIDDEERKLAGNVEDRRREIGKLEDQLESLQVLRAVTIAEYARAIKKARNLGYPEEFLLDEVL